MCAKDVSLSPDGENTRQYSMDTFIRKGKFTLGRQLEGWKCKHKISFLLFIRLHGVHMRAHVHMCLCACIRMCMYSRVHECVCV